VQVDTFRSHVACALFEDWQLTDDELHSFVVFYVTLRPYIKVGSEGGTTGVYVGIGITEYHSYILNPHGLSTHALVAPGNAMSAASGRVSFMFGLSGAALSVDCACSSSLVRNAIIDPCCEYDPRVVVSSPGVKTILIVHHNIRLTVHLRHSVIHTGSSYPIDHNSHIHYGDFTHHDTTSDMRDSSYQ